MDSGKKGENMPDAVFRSDGLRRHLVLILLLKMLALALLWALFFRHGDAPMSPLKLQQHLFSTASGVRA